jgi:hypothetical protein
MSGNSGKIRGRRLQPRHRHAIHYGTPPDQEKIPPIPSGRVRHAEAISKLQGPFSLDEQAMKLVPKLPGAFVLGDTRDGILYVSRVGRSDSDINAILKTNLGKYQSFAFLYCNSPIDAFNLECAFYHRYGPPSFVLDNEKHPNRQGQQCPWCKHCKLNR